MSSISTLHEDLLFEIGSYLSIEDELKINYKLREKIEPSVRKIQLWYKKDAMKQNNIIKVNMIVKKILGNVFCVGHEYK